MTCSQQPPLRLCKTERVDKPERKRVDGGRGWGGLFVKSLAVCLLQAKNTTLPGLQQSPEEWGHACVSVGPYPTAGGWRSGRRTVQRCWGLTGGQTGMWLRVCTVLTVCLARGVAEPQFSAAVPPVEKAGPPPSPRLRRSPELNVVLTVSIQIPAESEL